MLIKWSYARLVSDNRLTEQKMSDAGNWCLIESDPGTNANLMDFARFMIDGEWKCTSNDLTRFNECHKICRCERHSSKSWLRNAGGENCFWDAAWSNNQCY